MSNAAGGLLYATSCSSCLCGRNCGLGTLANAS